MAHVIVFRAPLRYWCASALIVLVCLLALQLQWIKPANASFAVQVQVISHELHNGQCMDGWGFCNRPELLVQTSIDTNDGRPQQICRGPINPSFDNIVEDQNICGSPRQVEGDFTVTVALIDDDNGTDDALDIAPGDAWAWTVSPRFRNGQPDQRSVTTSGGPSWMRFTVLVTPVAAVLQILSPKPGPGGAPPVFDPTIGERISFRVARNAGTRTRFEVTSRPTDGSAPQTWNVIEGVAWGSGVTVLDWDGSLAPSGSSQPLPDGQYELSLKDIGPTTGGNGQRVGIVVEIRRAVAPEIRLADVQPDPAGWDFRNGPVRVRGSVTVDGSVHMEVFELTAGSGCAAKVRTTVEDLRARGAVEFGWDGRSDANALVAAGRYCLIGILRTSTGLLRSTPLVFEVRNPAAGLMAWVFPDPIIPIEAAGPAKTPPTFTARAVDGQHRNRSVATMTIEAAAAGQAGVLLPFAPRPIVTCRQAATCSAVLPPDLAGASAIAYRVSAAEADDVTPEPQRYISGWRITDLNPPPNRTWRASVPATVTEAGEITSTSVDTRFDIVYYPGTGNDLSNVDQARHFAAQVADNMAHLFGMGGARGATTMAAHVDAMAFIVSPQRPAVAVTLSGKVCSWSGLVKVSYADAHGVLHNTTCRDVSYPWSHEYSSDNPVVDWHELHHSLYDESDEYCCDGGYHDDRVNVYSSLNRCQSDTAAPPAGCAQISDGTTTINWWRGGPAVNVMVNNTIVENPDDLRAADAAFARCGRRQC